MKHLTDEQLGARLDGELPARAAEAAERHLAACAECRDRLAALAGSDAALSRSLERDPGEKYFATFADRVQGRIAAGAATAGPREARAADKAPASGGWFGRPSTLQWAGAAATLVVVGVFAIQFATQQGAGARRAATPRAIVGADRLERAKAPAAAPPVPATPEAASPGRLDAPAVVSDGGAPAAGGSESYEASRQRKEEGALQESHREPPSPGERSLSELVAEEEAMKAAAKARGTRNASPAPQNVPPPQLGGVPATPPPPATQPAGKAKSFSQPPADAVKSQKPASRPMAPTPAPSSDLKKSTGAKDLDSQASRANEQKLGAAAVPPPGASGVVTQSSEGESGLARADADEAAPFRLCGTVANAQGRTLAGATVTVVETGRSVTSGSDGSFCVEAPSPGATLSVLALGYQEFRAKVRDESGASPFAVTLRSVETLGPGGTPTARLETVPPPVTGTSQIDVYAKRSLTAKDAPNALSPATIAPLPGETPDATAARKASEAAMRTKSAILWSRAGALWTNVAAAAKTEAAANEARYRAAEARMNTWRLARESTNRDAAVAAIDAFLAKSPADARRQHAEAWRKELPAR